MRGKVALVTGSTSGIGFRIAERLAIRGASVALNGRNAPDGAKALERLKSVKGKLIFEAGNASRYDEISRVVAAVEKRFGPIDILVSSGGAEKPGPTLFHELKPEDFLRGFETRFLPRVFPVHAVLNSMRERQSGSIVLIASDAARHPTPGESLIGSVAAATILTTKVLAREFSRWGIRVNCVALTLTSDTPGYDRIFSTPSFANSLFSKALKKFPAGRAPTAEEVARVVGFLASDEAAQVTGQTISANGGLSFGGW
ncbi:MAG: SDR family oxidoreductase [Betaproteobacteria bacterium]|nr:SDR family oxidoreductase [Betaproteobacteria bacterium]